MGQLSRGALLIVVVGIATAGLLRFQQPAEPKKAPFEELRPGLYRHSLDVSPVPQVFQVRRSLQQGFEGTGHVLAHLHVMVFPSCRWQLGSCGELTSTPGSWLTLG